MKKREDHIMIEIGEKCTKKENEEIIIPIGSEGIIYKGEGKIFKTETEGNTMKDIINHIIQRIDKRGITAGKGARKEILVLRISEKIEGNIFFLY